MSTVGVNGRTVVHKGSAGFSIAPNDVCFTPTDTVGVPVPYVNQGLSRDAVNEAFTVYSEGHRVMNAKSSFGMTSGDEPGSLGGVISETFMGMASFANFSCDVYVEGEPTPRAFDPMMQNHGSPYNAFGPSEIQAILTLAAWEIVCGAICFCHAMKMKMFCFKRVLAERRYAEGPYGRGAVWDPYLPGIWIEVPYYDGSPPGVYYSEAYSKRHVDENGNPLPLPAPEYPPPPGSSRPDVVIVKDPTKPPEPGNIAEVYEVKFPPDGFGPGNTQMDRYKAITGVEPQEASPALCGCGNKKEEEKKRNRKQQRRGPRLDDPPPLPAPLPHQAPKQAPQDAPGEEPQGEPWWEIPPLPGKPGRDLTPFEWGLIFAGIGILLAMGAVPVPAPA